MTWTQPLCRACWDRERPHDQPHQRTAANNANIRCCMCNQPTTDGIWAKYNPDAVPYPYKEPE
jgi:hypothetical protein